MSELTPGMLAQYIEKHRSLLAGTGYGDSVIAASHRADEIRGLLNVLDEVRATWEVDQEKATVRQKMLRYIAFVLSGDENADAQMAADRTQARIEALFDANRLANIIRAVDGNHSLGAGALAEAIITVLGALPLGDGEAVECDTEENNLTKRRRILSTEEAIAMLPTKERIHTFRGAGASIVGADWNRSDVLEALGRFNPELSGALAASLGHRIVIEDEHGYLFIETVDDRLPGKHGAGVVAGPPK